MSDQRQIILAAHHARLPMSELRRIVLAAYDDLAPEYKNGRYSPATLLDHIRSRLDSEAREDLFHANRLKRASLESAIEKKLEERAAWVRKGTRRR